MNRPAGRAAVQSPRWCKVVSDGGGDLMSATFLPGGRFAIAVDAGQTKNKKGGGVTGRLLEWRQAGRWMDDDLMGLAKRCFPLN
ncbi:hypothetical protein CABS01_02253 [Colletotrichum abscissum]|uniref:Uncharacterized protein n=1 Tax=Colletotrichum abscissum TaxID=1671311 RepID=A0A9Q0B5W5_9PEZI|nr:uncharacterized protein CABS01_02253 [Colletotrichum abscissum]KAI3554404.1 hypothetical protein CABS02_05221 [Colletotrichum abscissum]KAK1488623.1 hypothetical protein CABS01_02253 [Colletotrichum abscissum]